MKIAIHLTHKYILKIAMKNTHAKQNKVQTSVALLNLPH